MIAIWAENFNVYNDISNGQPKLKDWMLVACLYRQKLHLT